MHTCTRTAVSAITIKGTVGAVGAQWSAGLLVGAGSGARLAAKTLKAAENNASPKTDLATISTTVKRKF